MRAVWLKRAECRGAKPLPCLFGRFELGLALTLARATQINFPRYAVRDHCVRLGGSAVKCGEWDNLWEYDGNMAPDQSSDRRIAYDTTNLSNERAPTPSLDLSGPPRSHVVPTESRRSYRLSRNILTRVPPKVKKRSSPPESTPVPASSREIPIYLIYFGVSIWAALAGYGAHFYFSPHKTTSVHQGEAQPPASHMPSQTFSRPSKALTAWSQMLKC